MVRMKRRAGGKPEKTMEQLVIEKLRSRGLTSQHLAQYERTEEFTREQLVRRFDEFVSRPENLQRQTKAGKTVPLLMHEVFRNFANHYAEAVAKELGIKLLSARMRSVSRKERLLNELVKGVDTSEPLMF
jgi:hypothetical protein